MMMMSASASIWNLTMSMVDRAVREEGTGNALFSPVSIMTTLNMLLLGTTGLTRQEIITALGDNHSHDDDDSDDGRIPPVHGRCPRSILPDYPEYEQGHRGTSGYIQCSFSPGLRLQK